MAIEQLLDVNLARAWAKLYKTARWQALRRAQLTAQPLCQWCRARGLIVAAEVVHHVDAHKGDPEKFYRGDLQSLCKPCHDSEAQSEERTGYSNAVGADGWPVDKRHPANR